MKIIGNVAEILSNSNRFLRGEAVCTDGEDIYMATTSDYSIEITPDNIDEIPKVLVLPDHFQPKFDPGMHSVVPEESMSSCYLKVPNLNTFDAKDKEKLLRLALHEVKICEVLNDRHIQTSLTTLDAKVVYRKAYVDKEKCVEDILRGKHIHSLWYCYNDINPINIMLCKDGTALIIDFDSCQPTGHKLGMKKGTVGHCDETAEMSEEKNDYYSLEKLREFLNVKR